jgi:pimeloyl-ACP methyl ester carboxylesterase
LIHGFTLDARIWEGVVARLSSGHTVVSYDVRGFGRSTLPTEPYAHRDDLLALLDAQGLGRVHVVGHSVGAHQALEFALAYPDRVDRLALVAPAALGGVAFPPDIAAAFAAIDKAAKQDGVEAAKAIWRDVGWFSPARERPDLAAALDEILKSYSGWHWLNRNPAVPLDPPPAARLAEVRAPTLAIVGARDLPYDHEIAEKLAEQIPNARKLVLPDVGHMVPMEAPQALSAALIRFFSGA